MVGEWIGHSAFSAVVAGSNPNWQWVRSAIITEAVFRSFLITPRWLPRGIPVSSANKKLQRSNSKLVTSCGGRLSAHLLSLHNKAGVAGSQSALTSHRFKYKALVKIWHSFIYLFIVLLLLAYKCLKYAVGSAIVSYLQVLVICF